MKRNLRVRRVVIFQKTVPHYRVAFFEALKKHCEADGIELVLVAGDGMPGEMDRVRPQALPWARNFSNTFFRLGRMPIVWQRGISLLRRGDLVIVEQAVKLPLNYILLALHKVGWIKLCFWGHGKNFQESNPQSAAGRLKSWMTRQVHWFFAYNELSRRVVEESGFPRERITAVMNAVDTVELEQIREQINQSQTKTDLRRELGLVGSVVGLYCGGIYPAKLPEFLIEAADVIRSQMPDFELVLIGKGESLPFMEFAQKSRPWMRCVGEKFGIEKVKFYLAADVVMIPASVGLAILDAFALGCIFATTKGSDHGPEIDYLHPGENGLITPRNVDAYAIGILELLRSGSSAQRLRSGAQKTASLLTIANMATNFRAGILKAIHEA